MNFTSVKLSNNALNFLLTQYRAIFKRAYVKGLAAAVMLTAGLAAGQAQADTLDDVATLPQDGQTAIITGNAGATGTYDPETKEAEFDRIDITSGEGALNGTINIISGAAGVSGNLITATLGYINISGTGTLSIKIKDANNAATEGLLIGGFDNVTIDIGTIDVQTGLLKVTDGRGGHNCDVVLSADIINIGSENGGSEAYLTASSDSAYLAPA